MAYTIGTLALNASAAPGNAVYYHDAGADSMATVLTTDYFNNTDDDLNLVADDLIFSQCADGDIWHKVSAVTTATAGAISSGSVTTQLVSGEGPWNGDKSTGSATAGVVLPVGVTEIGTGTATAFLTPTPYPGARVAVFQTGAATGAVIAVSSSGVTFNEKGDTSIIITAVGGGFSLLGVSTTQWAITSGTNLTLA